MDDIYKLIYN